MTKRRLIIDGMIVAAAIGLLVTPYLVPERTGAWRGGYYSRAQCTQFTVVRDSAVPGGDSLPARPHWTASITISNVGPRRAELLAGEIVSRFKNGSESWPVPMPGLVLGRGAATSITVQLPVTGSDQDGPRIWELRGQYRTRDSKAVQWLIAFHDRLPREMQMDRLIYRPGIYSGSFVARYPENYDFLLTNELGWQFKIVSLGINGRGLHREWRPGVGGSSSSTTPAWLLGPATNALGKPVIVTATTPPTLDRIGFEPTPGMVTTAEELTFYSGQLAQISGETIQVRARLTNSTQATASLELRTADILGIKVVIKDAGQELRQVMQQVLGQRGPASGSEPLRAEKFQSSSAAGSGR